MENTLTDAIDILKRLPEKGVEQALELLKNIKDECDKEKQETIPKCVKCGDEQVIRNGHKKGKQAYQCKSCGKSFVSTTGTAIAKSHSGEAVWKQVIRDTVNGVPIARTAESLLLHHETVFNMRHKILFCLEDEEIRNPTVLEGVCEADETYVLESYKGAEVTSNFRDEPRKNGAVATMPGVSNEYICICTGVERSGSAIALTVNRATASKKDIERVFGERVDGSTMLLSDGAKGYGILEKNGKCKVVNANKEDDGFFNINTVNNFHSNIKQRYRNARGFATKYLNRYNALFSKAFRASKLVVDDIYQLLCDNNMRTVTIHSSQTTRLLLL